MQLKLSKIKPTDYEKVLHLRLEECVVAAKSERAKRRLYETAIDLAYMEFAYEQHVDNSLNEQKKGWSWKSLTNWKIWKK
jgi:hypothetical protein